MMMIVWRDIWLITMTIEKNNDDNNDDDDDKKKQEWTCEGNF